MYMCIKVFNMLKIYLKNQLKIFLMKIFECEMIPALRIFTQKGETMEKVQRQQSQGDVATFNMQTGKVKDARTLKKPSVKDSSCCTCTGFVTKSLSLLTPVIAAAYHWKGQIAENLPENIAGEFLKGMDVVGQVSGFLQTGVEEAMKGEFDSTNAKVAVGTGLLLAVTVACVLKRCMSAALPKNRQQ